MINPLIDAFESYFRPYPIVFIDIGAGGEAKCQLYQISKHIKVVGFEPDARSFDGLKIQSPSKPVIYLQTAVYREKGAKDFFCTRNVVSSSLYKPNHRVLGIFMDTSQFDVTKVERVNVDTLDNQLANNGVDTGADFLKIDTQGSELDILEGAVKTLSKPVFAAEVEAEFVPIYENQPLFSDVDTFLRKQGFELFDLRTHHNKRVKGHDLGRRKGQLLYAETLYFRKPDVFASLLENLDPDQKKAQILKAVLICVLFGYLDYASEIFLLGDLLFSPEEKSVFKRIISKTSFRKKIFDTIWKNLPHPKLRAKLANYLHALFQLVDPPQPGGRLNGRALGNLE